MGLNVAKWMEHITSEKSSCFSAQLVALWKLRSNRAKYSSKIRSSYFMLAVNSNLKKKKKPKKQWTSALCRPNKIGLQAVSLRPLMIA